MSRPKIREAPTSPSSAGRGVVTTSADLDKLVDEARAVIDQMGDEEDRKCVLSLIVSLAASVHEERVARTADLAQAIAECDDEARRAPPEYDRASFQAGACRCAWRLRQLVEQEGA